ncbi:MAG: NADPH:quinone oxidoreductase family protein [Hyphomicrobiales bacterium]|nr:NADPH:quinone oxidoreductase family protein [Hyphomicrobiales bacterium]
MKAIVCNEYGPIENLEFTNMPDPEPGSDDVVISVTSAGVNFPDALLVKGLYQAKPPTPFVPGGEVVGVIREIGDQVTRFSVGDKVAALCQYGGWAERVKCDQNLVMAMPENANEDEVTALLCGYGTAHHALKQRADLKAGETLVVTGASGLTGLAAVQIGKAMGAKVIAVASSEDKLALAKKNGADILLGYDNLKDELKKVSDGKGVDVIFDVVGGDVFDACSRAMAWEGRLLVIGFASGSIPKFPINLALVKGYSVVGVFWGSFARKQPKDYAANMMELMQWYSTGKIKPHVGQKFTLENASAALQHILDRKAVGKIVLNP